MNITEVKSERSEREGLRSEFRQILLELAASTNPGVRNQSVRRLETLYHKKQFRHFYSDVFSVLREVKESPKKGSIDFLGDNVASLWEDYQPKNKDESGQLIDISENLQKLYDHVSLDLARIAYADSGDSEVSGKTAISDINMRITELNNKEEKIHQRVVNAQKDYVTLLGIFAAIVLAFTGGIAFSSSVLQNLHKVGIYKIVFVLLIIGIVLVNFLFALLFYIDRINAINADKQKNSRFPFFIANGVLLLLLIATGIAWFFGLVEIRNRCIQEKYTVSQHAEIAITSESSEVMIDLDSD